MKYEIKFAGQFKKDLKLAKKQGKNLDKLFDVRGPFRTVQVKNKPASFRRLVYRFKSWLTRAEWQRNMVGVFWRIILLPLLKIPAHFPPKAAKRGMVYI